jgi:hypothetical protein
MKKHVNVGTIGHIDYGLNRTTTAMTLGTGDYIDPTPWTEEDHDRFIKAIEKVRELNNLDEETVRNHPHTKILASMGVEYVNGFKVNK